MWNYKEVWMPNHPKARPNGCVLEHRLIAETIVGRILKDEEVVHHIDENRSNNELDNLVIFITNDDHARFHKTGIMIKNDDGIYYSPKQNTQCKNCNNEFELKDSRNIFCSKKCYNLHSRKAERPSKDELFELIRTTSFTSIAKIYNVSDNAVRRWCKSYGLPYRKKDIVNLKHHNINA